MSPVKEAGGARAIPPTVGEALRFGSSHLRALELPSADLEAGLLLGLATGKSRLDLLTGTASPLDATAFHLHAPVHKANPAARCVLHTHMPNTTALCMIKGARLEPAHQSALGYVGRTAYDEHYAGLALTWDEKVDEPYCTGCMVCVRYCPTQCMSATMIDNPLFKEGKSKRRKIMEEFEINFGRCIVCGICVDVCNFDAILMSHEHELSVVARNGNRANGEQLLKMGREYQEKSGWKPAAEAADAAKQEVSA
jgi:formate hydrogenlyase subunit 6/NADH:ubiquinone oxidoreductase subunit I